MDKEETVIGIPENDGDMPEQDGKNKKGKRKGSLLRRAAAVVMILILLAVAGFAGFSLYIKHSASPVGYWVIQRAEANGVTMTGADAEAMGLSEIGYFRLNKSGSCTIKILDSESEGRWKRARNGVITIKYDKTRTLKATIDDNKVMTAENEVRVKYTLKK